MDSPFNYKDNFSPEKIIFTPKSGADNCLRQLTPLRRFVLKLSGVARRHRYREEVAAGGRRASDERGGPRPLKRSPRGPPRTQRG